ncbi:catalase [Pilimelia columellifera]|uniref:Catalase n=1 Tax=Pilimelia columellifera subsp. columellifera TaxID=706583 RepID=A0ABN3NEQ1_9ACTN
MTDQSAPSITTTDSGAPAPSDDHSLTQGAQGPILLHDHYLIEKLAQFNRERVPERVVHAKGAGAFGELVITGDVSAYTRADFLQPGRRTDMLARFSTVAGEQGSPDTWRDPRGFALKFYTAEGNYDLVGNNTPVFFLQDPIKFPDFIRSQKRMPDSGLRDHHMQWDFWTLRPESAHQVTWLMGDRGIPASYRHMDGFGSHTYLWVNAVGERFFVKYHFKTNQGIRFLTQAEADELAGSAPDAHRQDLFAAIARGEHPSWSLEAQIMPYAEADAYRFNPFDLTKVWSQKEYPRIKIGTMTLNRNPDNFFAQIEQAAFAPSNFVPGVEPSPDKMLLGRIFAYADAHRYRVGANHAQLPVNAPKCPVRSYSKEGAMRFEFNAPDVPVYAPNSSGGPHADEATHGNPAGWDSAGGQLRAPYLKRRDDGDFVQAGTLCREVLDDDARRRLADNIIGHVSAGVREPVLGRVFAYWHNVDPELGKRVEEGVRARLG